MNPQQGGLLHENAAPHVAKLGLLSEPFAGTDDGQHFFYADVNREQRLDLMQHLAPYSEVLVAIGAPGVGKTTLLQQFVARASETWRMAVVTAQARMSRDEFMAQLMEGFGLAGDEGTPAEERRAGLVNHLRALRQSAQVPILLVDDAHQLDAEVLELVLDLCEENDAGHLLSVILFGNPQLQSKLAAPALAPLQGRVAHTFDIPPFSEQETARYIRHRMRAAGAQGEGPFNPALISKIHDASGGIPSLLNEMAHHIISDSPAAAPERRRGAAGARPAGGGMDKRWIAVALAGVAVAALLLAGRFGDDDAGDGDAGGEQPMALSLPETAGREGESRVLRDEGEEVMAMGEAPPAAPAPSEPVFEAPMAAAEPPLPEPVPETPAEASPPPAPPVAAAAPPPAPKAVEPTPKPSTPPAAGDGIKREDWLRAQPPASLTLQLMALKDEKSVRRLIERHKLQDEAAYFRVQRKGQTLYAMVYGVYPSREAANRAAKKLPAGLVSGQPWVRSFKSIHEEIAQ